MAKLKIKSSVCHFDLSSLPLSVSVAALHSLIKEFRSASQKNVIRYEKGNQNIFQEYKRSGNVEISPFCKLRKCIWPNKNICVCDSGYPTYPNFLPPTLNFFLHFGQTFHLKKKLKTRHAF